MLELIITVLTAAVRSGTPILYLTQGEIVAEKSGNLNVGLEGMMLVGALAGFAASRALGNPWAGILAALMAGAALSAIHAFLTISLGANQIVSGLALVFFGSGLSAVIGFGFVGMTAPGFEVIPLGFLSRIPVLGQIFFRQDGLVYASYFLTPLIWIILFKTRIGLKIRAIGEDPGAADAAGLRVSLVRYLCVLTGGALAGIAGAYISLAYTTMWQPYMTGGRGWIAIALVIFARWDPRKALVGSYLFGGVTALQFAIQVRGTTVSPHFLQMMPYVFTILVLVFAMWRAKRLGLATTSAMGPASLAQPYSRE